MILLGYIIMAHRDWRKSHIKIFIISPRGQSESMQTVVKEHIVAGRLPITLANIEIVDIPENKVISEVIVERSYQAGLTIIGFREEIIKHDPVKFFTDFQHMGDTLFVNSSTVKEIN